MSDPADGRPDDGPDHRPGLPKPLFDRSEDHAYFRALEKLFIELRGAPFQLSPDDFKIARLWRAEGVPLDVALATLREKITETVEKGDEPKRRLSYYRRAVRGAWKRQAELAAPGVEASTEALDVGARLARLASRLPDEPSGPMAEIRARVGALRPSESGSKEGAGAEEIDKALAKIDEDMLDAARNALTDEQRAELDAGVEAALEALAGRLGGASSSARERAEVRWLRDVARLPMLSLFSPDALDG